MTLAPFFVCIPPLSQLSGFYSKASDAHTALPPGQRQPVMHSASGGTQASMRTDYSCRTCPSPPPPAGRNRGDSAAKLKTGSFLELRTDRALAMTYTVQHTATRLLHSTRSCKAGRHGSGQAGWRLVGCAAAVLLGQNAKQTVQMDSKTNCRTRAWQEGRRRAWPSLTSSGTKL